jgi:hypothetical protein
MKISRIRPIHKWRVDADCTIRIKALRSIYHERHLFGRNGEILATVARGRLTIREGFSSDGATCAPDFRRCLRGVFVHDVLLALYRAYPGFFDEHIVHDAMLEVHTADRFALRHIYYYAVSGWLYRVFRYFCGLTQKERHK